MTKLYAYAAGVVVVVLLLSLGLAKSYNLGYDTASGFYKLEIAAIHADAAKRLADEVTRQNDANTAAKARERQLIAELDAMEAEDEILRGRQQDEAAKDPGAGDIVLRAPSLRRLNEIQ